MRIGRGNITIVPIHIHIKLEPTDTHENSAFLLKRALALTGFDYVVGITFDPSTVGRRFSIEQPFIELLLSYLDFEEEKNTAVIVGHYMRDALDREFLQSRTKHMQKGNVLLILQHHLASVENVQLIMDTVREKKPELEFSALLTYEH